MDLPSGEWFFELSDVVITSYPKERAHINSKDLYKNKKILYTENSWNEDNESKIVAVYSDFLNQNLYRFNLFKSAKIFLTHNSDTVIDETLTKNWLDKNPDITLYAQNLTFEHPRAFVLPIGQANSMWLHGSKEPWKRICSNKDIDILLTHCEMTTSLRSGLNQLNDNHITKVPKCNYNEYVSYLQRSKFVICPLGNGPDTHRLWETLAAGAIPIVIKDKFIEQLIRTFPDINLVIVENFNQINFDKLIYNYTNMNFIHKSYWIDKLFYE